MREKYNQQMRVWAMLCHLSALLAWILLFALILLGIPLFIPLNIALPLIIWQMRKIKYPWVDFQGKEALNFQITLTFYIVIIVMISLSVVLASCGIALATNGEINQINTVLDSLLFIWMSFIVALFILQLFLVTFAATKAYNGEHYRYPFTMRLLK
ncbi:DUF4870 domain-containing protein [Nostoc sp. UHCC 0870]|uniref:DUF4870 domain-containing protein n=1 Tax=Nostoc sp. UHCC 0870 TaxID=2914041 RepID=UPI001EE0F524|nr:DUF4870 domain-containing protein [Nostoc sp. UHCC 0870]UKO97936.1 DUF4870 domain-containing protein [Nostoc sp. UHCC 0870]